jgi:hypothetical protein
MSLNSDKYHTSGLSFNAKGNKRLLNSALSKAINKPSPFKNRNMVEAPRGYHIMPDGRVMSDSLHKMLCGGEHKLRKMEHGGEHGGGPSYETKLALHEWSKKTEEDFKNWYKKQRVGFSVDDDWIGGDEYKKLAKKAINEYNKIQGAPDISTFQTSVFGANKERNKWGYKMPIVGFSDNPQMKKYILPMFTEPTKPEPTVDVQPAQDWKPEGYDIMYYQGQALDPDIYGYHESTTGAVPVEQLSANPAIFLSQRKKNMEQWTQSGDYPWGKTYKFKDGGYIPKMPTGGDTDYFEYTPLSSFGKSPGLETYGNNRLTTDLTFGRSNIAPRLAQRQGFESIGASLTTRLPYQNKTGVGFHGNLKFVGDRWKALQDVTKANVEADLSGGYDPKVGGYASLIASPQFTFGNVSPTMAKLYQGKLREGEWLAKVGPYAGVSATPGREKVEERFAIPAGVKGGFDVGIGKGKTIGASGYFGGDVFGQASSAGGDPSGLLGRTQYGFDVNLKLPFGRSQKRKVADRLTKIYDKAFPEEVSAPSLATTPQYRSKVGYAEGGEVMELTDKEIQELRAGGHIVVSNDDDFNELSDDQIRYMQSMGANIEYLD